MIRHAATLAALAALSAALPGCEDDAPPAAPPPARPAAAPAPGANRPGQNARRPGEEEPPPPMQITDSTFVSDINRARDPFRSYFSTFVLTGTSNGGDQVRDVKLGRYSLDDLHLVAVVLGTDSPYAMVIDPSRTGTILRRGMYVGRQEFVQTPQGGYNTHWRVARIEPGRYHHLPNGEYEEIPAAIVFERTNPLDSNAQVVERAITLASGVAGAQTEQQGTPTIGPIPGVGASQPGYLPPNLGGVGGGGGGGATGAILGTQSAVRQAVGGGAAAQPAPTPQTTVVVQVPPTQSAVQPVAPSTTPPPVQIYNGNNSTH